MASPTQVAKRAWLAVVLVGLAVVAITAGVAVVRHRALQREARLLRDQCLVLAMREAIAVYYRLHGRYPAEPGRLAACPPLTAPQADAAAAVRGIVEAAVRLYGTPPLAVAAGPEIAGLAASYRPGLLIVAARALTSPHLDAVVAHELAHHVLRHPAPNPADDREDQPRREMDANATAVEILMRVQGRSEPQALSAVHARLAHQHRRHVAGRVPLAPGHAAPCDEIADLLARFPEAGAGLERPACPKPRRGSGPGPEVSPPARRGGASGGRSAGSRSRSGG